jgi:hypothetical protein
MGTFIKIQTITVGSGGIARVEFTNIPQTYRDLQLVISTRGKDVNTTGTEVYLNSVAPTGSNYVNRYFEGNIQNAAGSNSNTNAFFTLQGNNSFTASTFGNCVVYIPNYTQTTSHKTLLSVKVTENNANVVDLGMNAGTFLSNNAITSLLLEPDGNSNFTEYSTATLYGIKNT